MGIRNGKHVTKGTEGIDTSCAVFCNGHLSDALVRYAVNVDTEGKAGCMGV